MAFKHAIIIKDGVIWEEAMSYPDVMRTRSIIRPAGVNAPGVLITSFGLTASVFFAGWVLASILRVEDLEDPLFYAFVALMAVTITLCEFRAARAQRSLGSLPRQARR